MYYCWLGWGHLITIPSTVSIDLCCKSIFSPFLPSFTSFAYRRMPKSPEVLVFISYQSDKKTVLTPVQPPLFTKTFKLWLFHTFLLSRRQIERLFWPLWSHFLHRDFHTLTLSHFPSVMQTDNKCFDPFAATFFTMTFTHWLFHTFLVSCRHR